MPSHHLLSKYRSHLHLRCSKPPHPSPIRQWHHHHHHLRCRLTNPRRRQPPRQHTRLPHTQDYTYDPASQLTTVQDTLAAATTAYTYDPVGNRTRLKRTHIANPALNQYTTYHTALPTYDANGNLTSMAGATYSYDARSLLVAAEGPPEANPGPMTNILTLTRDTRRRITRLQHNAHTTYRIYDSWHLIAEYTPSGTLLKEHIHGPRIDEILATLPANNTPYYHHHDALGNTVALTNATSGDVLETSTYDPFGKRTIYNATGQTLPDTAYGNTHGYTGREHLPISGLMDYRNRSYSTNLGRFLQTDPIRFEAGDGNLYRYVGNEPVAWIDSQGLKSSNSTGAGTPQRGNPGTQKIPPNHVPEGPGNFPTALRNLANFIHDTNEQRETNQGANSFGEIVAKCNSWKNSLPNLKCACCPTVILLLFTRPSIPPRKNILGMNIPWQPPSGGARIIDYQMNFVEKKCSEVAESDFPPGFLFDPTFQASRGQAVKR